MNKKWLNENSAPYVYSIALMGIFTFLFLGTEYLYVDVLSRLAPGNEVVLAQNYTLGISAIGFLLFPLLKRFSNGKTISAAYTAVGAVSIAYIAFLCANLDYTMTSVIGFALFLLLGFLGSAVFYISARMLNSNKYLARITCISYAIGILLQFANNNLAHEEIAEAFVYCAFLVLLVYILIKADKKLRSNNATYSTHLEQTISKNASFEKTKNVLIAMTVLLVALMTCIFSALDNAITLKHATGVVDVGQWPRILLALSGLGAGFIFDLKKRKYMGIVMYCVMVFSTICIFLMKLSGPLLASLIVFYLSTGFFAVFFTTTFMDLSQYMKMPELWAGMGRALNNITAAIIANPILWILSSDNYLASLILMLLLFIAVSVITAVCTTRKIALLREIKKKIDEDKSEEKKLKVITAKYSLTDREAEVLLQLVSTEDSIQTIAENLFISRRTLERHITSIYEKTNIKSRIGLANLYNMRQ